MAFEIRLVENKLVDKAFKKAMRELNNFFGINWNRNTPRPILMPDRETIDQLRQKKTEAWVVGWSGEKAIYILAPNKFNKESCHKFSEKYYYQLIKHELVHAFVRAIIDANNCPNWLNEGLALFLAGQNKSDLRPVKFTKFLSYHQKFDKHIYQESGHAVELLVHKYGKAKLIRFLKAHRKANSRREICNAFESIYKTKLNYTTFNKLVAGRGVQITCIFKH